MQLLNVEKDGVATRLLFGCIWSFPGSFTTSSAMDRIAGVPHYLLYRGQLRLRDLDLLPD